MTVRRKILTTPKSTVRRKVLDNTTIYRSSVNTTVRLEGIVIDFKMPDNGLSINDIEEKR